MEKVFLIGGPAFSGTTLLTLMLNQGDVVCLDEPDFHNPEQSHRAIPFLQELFPEKHFPKRPSQSLDYDEAVSLIQECEDAIAPLKLGIKTCDWTLMRYARVCKVRGYRTIAIIRDIRDALVRPLPEWVTEDSLNEAYRLIWNNLQTFDLCLRYEDLIANPAAEIAKVSALLGYEFRVMSEWEPEGVPVHMVKLDRHELLKTGRLSAGRVGVWKSSGKTFSKQTQETAQLMGYQ